MNNLGKGKFGCESWLKYFKPSEDKGIKFQKLITNNERCLDYLTKYIPRYIDSILQFGCASGRDFIPFNEKYKLFGVQFHPESFMTEEGTKIIKNFLNEK